MWTFGRKIALGFAISIGLLILIGAVAYRCLSILIDTSHAVSHSHAVMETQARVLSLLKDLETGQRGFVITGADNFLEPYNDALQSIPQEMKALRQLTVDNAKQQQRLDRADVLIEKKFAAAKQGIDIRRQDSLNEAVNFMSAGEGKKIMDELRKVFADIEREERDLLTQRAMQADATAANGKSTIIFGTLLCIFFGITAAVILTRSLTNQIGTSVGHVQSSSAELQAAANQQAASAKEQATAMNEINTTISELLATSRQIAESAQRVAQIARETTGSAQAGELTVDTAHQSIGAIRQQVDLIVSSMLELGKKSQHIGAVLDIVSELAEQTNILAINATIEAAGAGEAGRRFAVVAEEIRKLADRVSGSTKEIRTLIDDVRSAVNTTVMTTETGSKAVDTGSRQFGEVASSFKQIVTLVSTTTEAAREIELSTKQQATAVEQVNVAIANVAQATRETETSSAQILHTASQLASLSNVLLRLVRAHKQVA